MCAKTVEFRFCEVCKRNHDQGRKHIFTKTHKNNLASLLGRFCKKANAARKLLKKPSVLEGELEPGLTLWCYCCQEEVKKHASDGLISVEWGGMLEHMASCEHHKKTRHFWWVHGASADSLSNYLVFEVEYQRYKQRVADCLAALEEKREKRLKKAAKELKAVETAREEAAREPPQQSAPPTPVYVTVRNQYGVMQNPTGWHEGRRVWGGGIVKYRPGSDQLLTWETDDLDSGSTVASHCGGGERRRKEALTFGLGPGPGPSSSYKDSSAAVASGGREGNVHSGAIPPWMKDEEDDDEEKGEQAPIGPSFDAFLKHKEELKRASKNPKRVGANFHKEVSSGQTDSENWLPSFGGLWNAGPRSHTKTEFLRGQKSRRPSLPPSSSPSSFSSSSISHHPTTLPLPSSIISSSLVPPLTSPLVPPPPPPPPPPPAALTSSVVPSSSSSSSSSSSLVMASGSGDPGPACYSDDGAGSSSKIKNNIIISSISSSSSRDQEIDERGAATTCGGGGGTAADMPRIRPYVRKRARASHARVVPVRVADADS